jgi:hypothetical protein
LTTYTTRVRGIVVRTEGAGGEPWESVAQRHSEEVDRQLAAKARVVHATGQSYRKKKKRSNS